VPDALAAALVSWDHSTPYPLPRGWLSGSAGFTKTFKLGAEHAFIADHNVDGRILMPVCAPFPAERTSLPCVCKAPASLGRPALHPSVAADRLAAASGVMHARHCDTEDEPLKDGQHSMHDTGPVGA
jgi:hypothetical protein